MFLKVFARVCQSHIVVLIALKLSGLFIDVHCCRVIPHAEDVEKIGKRLSDLSLAGNNNEGSSCLLDIQQDLPKGNIPQPLYIVPDTNQFWFPNARGQLEVPPGAFIELYCAKSFASATVENNSTISINNATTLKFTNLPKIASNTKTVRLRCLHDKVFHWQEERYELKQFICEQSTKYSVEPLHDKCPPTAAARQASVEAQMYRVGFNITANRFLEIMYICYDDTLLRTLYVQHKLLPASIHFQKLIKRLNFSKAGHFKNVNMNHLYSQHSQRHQAAVLLEGQHEHLFDNKTLFLARGHLAAKSDFIYGNQQRATFNFFNVAPQWQAFNGGQWAALEDEVRKFVARSNLLVDCYTGTFGTLQLPYKAGQYSDSNGTSTIQYRDFYLAIDNNNNGLLPVPKLFYRVVIDSSHHPLRGIALIGVNNPYVTLSEIKASYLICEDIHTQVDWLRWIRNTNLKKGFMYACRVADFVAAVGNLPKSLLHVTEVLI